MRILVVEDDENKRQQVISLLQSEFHEHDVVVATSLISALRLAKDASFDLVILDMTLPNYDISDSGSSGGMHAFGGEEFLRQLRRFGIRMSVIVLTQFETFGEPPETKDLQVLDRELAEEFPELYKGSIYYHAAISDWIDKLKQAIADCGKRG